MHVTSKKTVTAELAIIGYSQSSRLQQGLRKACNTDCIPHKALNNIAYTHAVSL